MEIRIEVFTKEHFTDSLGNEIASEVEHIGITSVDEIRMIQVYLVQGDLSSEDIERTPFKRDKNGGHGCSHHLLQG